MVTFGSSVGVGVGGRRRGVAEVGNVGRRRGVAEVGNVAARRFCMETLPASPGKAGTHEQCRDEEANPIGEERQPPCQGEQVAAAPGPNELLPGAFDRHKAPICHPELIRDRAPAPGRTPALRG